MATRSGNFGGTFDFSNDGNDPLGTGFAFANAYIGHIASYTEDMGRVPDNFYQATWAFYLQDTWKAGGGVTLNLGLRYDKSSLFGGDSNNFAPRLGAAWDLGGSPRFAFLPVAVSALLLVFVPLTIRFRD